MSTPEPPEAEAEARSAKASKRRLIQTRRPRAERAYLTRRSLWRHFLAGLPALVGAGGLIALAVAVRGVEPGPLRVRHLQRGLSAARDGREADALVALQRLADEGTDALPPRERFEAVQILTRLKDPIRAGAILEGLAPADRPGYPPAQVWRASRILDRPGLTRVDLDAAEAHLLQAVKAEPQYLDANLRLVQVYLASGRNKVAVPYLERAASARPEMLILLAKIDAVEGDRERAIERLKQARVRFETISKANPDDHEARLSWAEAALVMEDFPAAATILKEGFARSDDPRYSKALSRLYLAWHDVASKDAKTDLAARLDLLEQGLRYDPNNLLLLDRFSAPIRGGGEVAQRAIAALRDQIEKGRDTASVRYALGVHAFEEKRLDEARTHWGKAYELSPSMPFFANNYAYALAFSDPPEPSQALEIIGPVVERWPKVMAFRDTRGQVLAKLGRWYEARADLEEALRIGPPSSETHKALAEVYDHLDQKDQAAEQRRLAELKP
ncbi:MAG: tetratricopeptide repeat protein [Isosphaeraceae bacterium]